MAKKIELFDGETAYRPSVATLEAVEGFAMSDEMAMP
jgi:hypothetical protein